MRELELSDEHDGIIELPADAPVGAGYAAWAGLGDPVIEVAVTPNRQDCMGVRGIARDLAAKGLGALKPLTEAYRVASFDVPRTGPGPDVRTDDPAGCPAFYACTVGGVVNGAAHPWLAGEAARGRAAADLGAGRHHQLHHARPRAAAARL